MDKKECAKKDYMVLDAFYKEYFSKSHIQIGYWASGGLFLLVLVLICWFPYQTFSTEEMKAFAVVSFIGMYGSVAYMGAYRHAYDRKGTVVGITSYLQYLPISAKARKEYQLWKLLKLQWKVYVVAQVGQIVFSLLIVHELAWCNLLFTLLVALVIPVVMSALSIVVTK